MNQNFASFAKIAYDQPASPHAGPNSPDMRCTIRHNKRKTTNLNPAIHTGATTPSAPVLKSVADKAKVTALLQTILQSLEESKAEDIIPINIEGKSSIGDHMVIASGRSHRHVGAVADHLLRDIKAAGFPTAKVEGLPACDWVLADAGDVIVHIFRPEVREFYNLEKMWMTADLNDQSQT